MDTPPAFPPVLVKRMSEYVLIEDGGNLVIERIWPRGQRSRVIVLSPLQARLLAEGIMRKLDKFDPRIPPTSKVAVAGQAYLDELIEGRLLAPIWLPSHFCWDELYDRLQAAQQEVSS
jgi:hypothetical protein